MSWGMCICSTCKREVHQTGEIFTGGIRRATWQHCDDKSEICLGARADYAQSLSEVKGKWCGSDGKPGDPSPF